MMNFKDIHRYSNYTSYQRIKRIKQQQCNRGLVNTRCKYRSYQDYLDKKSGFVCCPFGNKKVNCSYTGILGKTDCITSTLTAVAFGPSKIGFDGLGGGSLLPPITWDGFTIVSFSQASGIMAPWHLQVKGVDVSGVVFDCIELTQGKKKIQLFQSESNNPEPGPPGGEATELFVWTNAQTHPPNAVLTPGRWTFRLCRCRC